MDTDGDVGRRNNRDLSPGWTESITKTGPTTGTFWAATLPRDNSFVKRAPVNVADTQEIPLCAVGHKAAQKQRGTEQKWGPTEPRDFPPDLSPSK